MKCPFMEPDMSKMSLFPEFPSTMTPETLSALMDDLQISGSVLAERLDVDRKTVSRWLNGDVPVPGPVALLIGVAHSMLRFHHSWAGEGLASQDVPSKRVR